MTTTFLDEKIGRKGRFLEWVIDQGSECWNVTSHGLNKQGYATVWRQGKHHLAHRYLWEMTKGKIPEGKKLCHHCDNPRCVNPEHLYVGTQADNMRDKVARNRQHKGEAHPKAKLTDIQIREIRQRYVKGVCVWNRGNARELAEEYGVHHMQISRIARFGTRRTA